MTKPSVFYSFHFDNDVMRTQMVRNIGAIERDEPVSKNEWETVKAGGNAAIERWIHAHMKYKQCVVVLIGSETSERPWVKYEIRKAWEDKRGLLGIYIHNLNCPRNGTCAKGPNPFDNWNVGGVPMSRYVTCHDPSTLYAYTEISENLASWVAYAVARAKAR